MKDESEINIPRIRALLQKVAEEMGVSQVVAVTDTDDTAAGVSGMMASNVETTGVKYAELLAKSLLSTAAVMAMDAEERDRVLHPFAILMSCLGAMAKNMQGGAFMKAAEGGDTVGYEFFEACTVVQYLGGLKELMPDGGFNPLDHRRQRIVSRHFADTGDPEETVQEILKNMRAS